MRRFRWLLLLGVGLPLFAQSSGIYKCTAGRTVAYQNFPCAEGQQETLTAAGSSAVNSPVQDVKPPATPAPPIIVASAQEARANLPFRSTSLQIGMSDDEILNLPHWGRPDKITRSKTNHVWHERWLYTSLRDGAKRLFFDNARLVAVQDEPAPAQQIVSLSLQ